MQDLANSPAFPVPSASMAKGVSYRDWLATAALQGIVAKGLDVIGDRVVSEAERNLIMARKAYGLADAMLQVAAESPPTK